MPSTINAKNTSTGVVITPDSSGQLELQTADTTRMTIDVNGNVGIGTATPSAKLDVAGQLGVSFANPDVLGIFIQATTGTNAAAMQYSNTGGNFFVGKDSSTGTRIGGTAYANCVWGESAYPLLFGTNNTERMRIDSSGNVLVGTTTTANAHVFSSPNVARALTAQNTNASPYGLYSYYPNAAPNGTGNEFLYCADSGTLRASIRSNGGLANFSANNVNLSDERLKTDITPAKSYLDTICSIPVVTFKYNDQTDEELNLGVIAQAVDAVAPELVDHNGFGEAPKGESPYLAVYQTDLQYALMKSIQELKTIIDTQAERIAVLENKIV